MLTHEKWLKIANEDLLVAEIGIKIEAFSVVTDHCNQSAEKALKGYLIFREHGIPITRNIITLARLCSRFDQNFEQIYESAKQLNPLPSKFNYPTKYGFPVYADAQEAIKHAQNVMNFVTKKINPSFEERFKAISLDTRGFKFDREEANER